MPERSIWMIEPAGGRKISDQDDEMISRWVEYIENPEPHIWRFGFKIPFKALAQAVEAHLPIGSDTIIVWDKSLTDIIQFEVHWAGSIKKMSSIVGIGNLRMLNEEFSELRFQTSGPIFDQPTGKIIAPAAHFLLSDLVKKIVIEADLAAKTIKGDMEGEIIEPPKLPENPSEGAPLEEWFDYYHALHDAGYKYTLKDVATSTRYAYGTIRRRHLKYKSARGIGNKNRHKK